MSHMCFCINPFGEKAILTKERLSVLAASRTIMIVDHEQVDGLLPTCDEALLPRLTTRSFENGETYVVIRLFTKESLQEKESVCLNFIGESVCNICVHEDLDDLVEGREALLFVSHDDGNGAAEDYFWGASVMSYYDKTVQRVMLERVPFGGRGDAACHLTWHGVSDSDV